MRKKQTAKKSTGGVAKRKLLVPSTRVLRSRQPSRSPQPATDVHMEEVPTEPLVAADKPGEVASQGVTKGNSDGDEVSRPPRLPKFHLLMAITVVPPLQ